MIASLANAMMSAQADQVCGAGYGQRYAERVLPLIEIPQSC
jgi:hypothetical protein